MVDRNDKLLSRQSSRRSRQAEELTPASPSQRQRLDLANLITGTTLEQLGGTILERAARYWETAGAGHQLRLDEWDRACSRRRLSPRQGHGENFAAAMPAPSGYDAIYACKRRSMGDAWSGATPRDMLSEVPTGKRRHVRRGPGHHRIQAVVRRWRQICVWPCKIRRRHPRQEPFMAT